MLWCSGALRSTPLRKGSTTSGVHMRELCTSISANSGFPNPKRNPQGLTVRDFRNTDQRMSIGSEQRHMRVAFSAAVVCLRGANPSSTEIFITTIPLYYTYTSNSNPPIIILHSHSSNQITSFTSSFPFPSFLNCKFPTTTYCPVYIRMKFNVVAVTPIPLLVTV